MIRRHLNVCELTCYTCSYLLHLLGHVYICYMCKKVILDMFMELTLLVAFKEHCSSNPCKTACLVVNVSHHYINNRVISVLLTNNLQVKLCKKSYAKSENQYTLHTLLNICHPYCDFSHNGFPT